jgi:hypothetical protein
MFGRTGIGLRRRFFARKSPASNFCVLVRARSNGIVRPSGLVVLFRSGEVKAPAGAPCTDTAASVPPLDLSRLQWQRSPLP